MGLGWGGDSIMDNPIQKILKDTNTKANKVIKEIKFNSEKTTLINEMYSHLITEKQEKIIELEKKLKQLETFNIDYKKSLDKLVENNNSLKQKVYSIEFLLIENINSID